jgi:hypothetical protein
MVWSKLLPIASIWSVLMLQTSTLAEITIEPTARGAVVEIDGELFTEYLTRAGGSPALWPVIGPTGKPMTRCYPFGPKVEGEASDHPHHQSMWFTHDQVNGADFWKANVNTPAGSSDRNRDNGAHIAHREFVKITSRGPMARIVTRNDWMDGEQRICEDERKITFGTRRNGDRWIDFTITIRANDGDVSFGDTKEGTFAVRVADTMRLEAKLGGRIENSERQIDDAAWGMPARWVDYTGPIDGETLGIAIFCHPTSFRSTPRWHVRGYGLFAANPFGERDFPLSDRASQGPVTIERGDSLTLRYRVLLHRGATKDADLGAAFAEFAAE